MISVTVYGTEIARKKLAAMSQVMSPDRRQSNHRKVGIQMHSDVLRTFQADGATFGRPKWEDLKAKGRYPASTVRPRKFTTVYQILRDTGALRAAYVPLSDEKLAGVGALSMKEHADIAATHQFGNLANNLPARPMLPTEDRAMEVMVSVYAMDIQKAVRS
jgi:phage gpG-like protein